MKNESEIIQEMEVKINSMAERVLILEQILDKTSLVLERFESRIEYVENRLSNIDTFF